MAIRIGQLGKQLLAIVLLSTSLQPSTTSSISINKISTPSKDQVGNHYLRVEDEAPLARDVASSGEAADQRGRSGMPPRFWRSFAVIMCLLLVVTWVSLPFLYYRVAGRQRTEAVKLGVIRLDYDYPPAPGDIDCPDSFDYSVIYRVVPGLTFEMCQSGKLTPEVEGEFKEAINFLVEKNVDGITGDCGFMMYFQKLARTHTQKPVFMSSLAQLPSVTCAFNKNELIAIFTANSETLQPMHSLIKEECGVDYEQQRFKIVGCQDVPGFESVALGEKLDVQMVTPGIVSKARKTLEEHPDIRAFLFECTQMSPCSDDVRAATGLPVFDSITCCDFFVSGNQDNKRFGLNDWREDWSGVQDSYTLGQNLDEESKDKLVNK